MPNVPSFCGACDFRTAFRYEGVTFWKCGHKYGDDPKYGTPGLINLDEEPPVFCPLRTLQGNTMVAMGGHGLSGEAVKAKQLLEQLQQLPQDEVAHARALIESQQRGEVFLP